MKLLIVLFYLLPHFLYCQNSSIEGNVVDHIGQPIPMAKILLSDGSNNEIRRLADLDGYFSIENLMPGRYDLWCTSFFSDTARIICIEVLSLDCVDVGSIVLSYREIIFCDMGSWPPPIMWDNDINKPFKSSILINRDFDQSPLRQFVGEDKNQAITTINFQEAQLVRGSRNGDVAIFIDGVKQLDLLKYRSHHLKELKFIMVAFLQNTGIPLAE